MDVDGAFDVFSRPFSKSEGGAASVFGSTEAGAVTGAGAGGAPWRLKPVLLNVKTEDAKKKLSKAQRSM